MPEGVSDGPEIIVPCKGKSDSCGNFFVKFVTSKCSRTQDNVKPLKLLKKGLLKSNGSDFKKSFSLPSEK